MNIWKVIQNGNSLKRTGRDCDGRVIILPPTTADEHIAVQRESKARTTLLHQARFGGNAESKKMRKSMLKQEFLEFRISEAEGLHKGYDRMQKILSQLNQLKAKPEDEDINLKFLRALPSSWSQVALTLKTKGGLEFLSFDDLYYKLKTLEVDIKGYSTFSSSQSADVLQSFVAELSQNNNWLMELEGFKQEESKMLKCLQRRHFARECRAKGGNDKAEFFVIQDSEEFGMIDGCIHEMKMKKVAAKIYKLDHWSCTKEVSTAGDAREFALIGVTSEAVKIYLEWDSTRSNRKSDG
ncbi:hypothetical protein Tco_0873435 [Tanacetum coccineum]|uniref:Uncharacterized protein n=1 Tax=Tanacetum coccineum TaxID=301880 RepID=A0ABQ5BMX7_9ASTR